MYRHTKFFTHTEGHPLFDADETEVNTYIDAECNPRYENVNPGTVNLEGFGAECWDYEEHYGSRQGIPYGVNLCPLSIPRTEQLLRRLDELRRNEPKVGVDPDQDERDLQEFVGDQAMASMTIAEDPDVFGKDKPLVLLYGILNRNDFFHDYRHVLNVSGRWMEDQRYFMWQAILTWEVARRLEADETAMSSAFTSKLLASMIVSDRYLQNCEVTLQGVSSTEDTFPVQQEKAEQDVTKYPGEGQDPAEKEKLRKMIENEKWNMHGKQLRLHSKVHVRQAEGLILFAETIKWPRLEEVREQVGKAYDLLQSGQQVSRNLHDWLFGLTLPGKWFSFTIMASLVSCTPSIGNPLLPRHVNCGLVMPNVTYWRIRTGLGRVIGSVPGVISQNGWLGPCPNVELYPPLITESEKARWIVIRSRPVPHNLPAPSLLGDDDDDDDPEVQYNGEEDIEAYVAEMENPENWTLLEPPKPDFSKCEPKSIRLTGVDPSEDGSEADGEEEGEPGVETKTEYYAASIEFQLSSANDERETEKSVTFNITSDPVFISCPPCHPPEGKSGHEFHVRQHMVYKHKVWTVEELRERKPEDVHDGDGDNDDDSDGYDKCSPVIVINATGNGTETLARAWCAEHGKSAIVRRQGGMCFSCAVRAAGIKGARVGVLIWVS